MSIRLLIKEDDFFSNIEYILCTDWRADIEIEKWNFRYYIDQRGQTILDYKVIQQ